MAHSAAIVATRTVGTSCGHEVPILGLSKHWCPMCAVASVNSDELTRACELLLSKDDTRQQREALTLATSEALSAWETIQVQYQCGLPVEEWLRSLFVVAALLASVAEVVVGHKARALEQIDMAILTDHAKSRLGEAQGVLRWLREDATPKDASSSEDVSPIYRWEPTTPPPRQPRPKKRRRVENLPPSTVPKVPEMAGAPSLEAFRRQVLEPGRPRKLLGLLRGWPAVEGSRPWGDLGPGGRLQELAGDRTVSVEVWSNPVDALPIAIEPVL